MGGGDRRLLAALAVMAVAFVSLAVCATFDSPDSDADASTGYITVEGVAGANERYDSFDQLYTDLKSELKTTLGNGNDDAIYVEQTVSADKFKAFFTDNSMGTANDYDAKITYTVHGTVEYDEKDHSYLLSLGRAASRFSDELHLSHFEIKGEDDAQLSLKSTITLPYQWWGKSDTHWTYLTLKDIKVVNGGMAGGINYLSIGQAYNAGIGITLENVQVSGLRCYTYVNNIYSYTAENCTFDGQGIDNAGMHFQGSDRSDAPANISIKNCSFNGYAYAMNVDQDCAIAKIEGCTFKTTESKRPCIQIAGCSELTVSDNTFYVLGNAFSFHYVLADSQNLVKSVSITGNTFIDATENGTAHFAYTGKTGAKEDGSDAISDETYKKVSINGNRIAATIDLKNGVNKYGAVSPTNSSIVISDDQVVRQSDSGTVEIEKDGVETSSKNQGGVSIITTTITVTENLDKSVKEALNQASLAGSAATGEISAQIVIKTTGDLEISSTSVIAMRDSGVSLSVQNSNGTVSLDNDVLNTLSDANAKVEISLTSASSLTAAQSAKIGSNRAIDVSAYVDDTKISLLEGNATISIPFDSKNTVRVTYVADDGSTKNIPCTYANGVVTFSTTHFSVYMISSAPTFIPVPDNRDDEFPEYVPPQTQVQETVEEEPTTEIAIIVGAIAVVLVAIVVLVYKSR